MTILDGPLSSNAADSVQPMPFHDPLVAEIRQIRVEIMAEHGDDLHRLCASLREDEARLVAEGSPILVAPEHPGLAERLRVFMQSMPLPT